MEQIQWRLINALRVLAKRKNYRPEQRLWHILDRLTALRTMTEISKELDKQKCSWPVMKEHPLVLDILQSWWSAYCCFFFKSWVWKNAYTQTSVWASTRLLKWALKVVPIPWMDSAHVISAFAQGVQLHPGVFRHWCDAMLRVNTGQWEYLFSNSVRSVRLECLMLSWSWYDVKKVVKNRSWNPEERLWS